LILAFDPGVTTGVAVLEEDGSIIKTYAFSDPDKVERFAQRAKVEYPNSDVVIEAPPQWAGNFRPLIQQVEEKLRSIFPDACWVNPGQWKGHPTADLSTLSGLGYTQHEKDTVGLGRWFRATRLNSARSGCP
jgi:hypothetical protein